MVRRAESARSAARHLHLSAEGNELRLGGGELLLERLGLRVARKAGQRGAAGTMLGRGVAATSCAS